MNLVEERPAGRRVERLQSEKMANPSIQNLNAFLVSKLSARGEAPQGTQGSQSKGKGKKRKVGAAGPTVRALSGPPEAIQRRAEPFLKELAKLVGAGKPKANASGSKTVKEEGAVKKEEGK